MLCDAMHISLLEELCVECRVFAKQQLSCASKGLDGKDSMEMADY